MNRRLFLPFILVVVILPAAGIGIHAQQRDSDSPSAVGDPSSTNIILAQSPSVGDARPNIRMPAYSGSDVMQTRDRLEQRLDALKLEKQIQELNRERREMQQEWQLKDLQDQLQRMEIENKIEELNREKRDLSRNQQKRRIEQQIKSRELDDRIHRLNDKRGSHHRDKEMKRIEEQLKSLREESSQDS